jgi:hypothetical protein
MTLDKIGATKKGEFNFEFFEKWKKMTDEGKKIGILGRMIRSCRNMHDVNICTQYNNTLSDFNKSCLIAWCCGEFAGIQGREIE